MTTLTRDHLIVPALIGAGLLGGLGCGGGDGATGLPNGDDQTVDIAGTWEFNRSFSTEFGATQITTTLHLQQNGSDISGTHTDGTYKSSLCGIFGCTARFVDIASGPVTGSVQGQTVILEFNSDDLGDIDRFEGTVSDGTISGSDWTAEPGTGGGDAEEVLVPEAPTNLQAVVVQTGAGTAVDLTWEDNSDDEDAFVVFENCAIEDWAILGEVDPDVTEARVPGPFPGTECEYAVLAVAENDDGPLVSDPSNFASVTLPVSFTVTGLSQTSGPVGTEVTIQGEGFTDWGSAPAVSVGGQSGTEFITSTSNEAITLLMPNGGGAGAREVTVTIGRATSVAVTWTQTGDEDASDPTNDDPDEAPEVSLPLDIVGSFSHGDLGDFHAFTLSSAATLELELAWNGDKDLDVYVTDPAGVTAQCEAEGATLAKPEVVSCELPAGEYRLLVHDFDGDETGDLSVVSYRITASLQ